MNGLYYKGSIFMGESFQDYSSIQDFEADFLWKVSLKMLKKGDLIGFLIYIQSVK